MKNIFAMRSVAAFAFWSVVGLAALPAHADLRGEVLRLSNINRLEQGLEPLHLDPALSAVAQAYAERMASEDFFSHVDPQGGTMRDRLSGISYRAAGENIAHGYKTEEKVMTGWMNSPGHRANILGPRYRALGVGFANNYWVQVFTN